MRRLENPYRDHAWLSRELARQLTDAETKAHLFEMAELYEKLATAADDQNGHSARVAGKPHYALDS